MLEISHIYFLLIKWLINRERQNILSTLSTFHRFQWWQTFSSEKTICFASSRILFINLFVAHNRLAQGASRSHGPTTGALQLLLVQCLLFHRPRPPLTTSDSPPPALLRPETALYDIVDWFSGALCTSTSFPLQSIIPPEQKNIRGNDYFFAERKGWIYSIG